METVISWLTGEQAIMVIFGAWMMVFIIAAPRLARQLEMVRLTSPLLLFFLFIVFSTASVAWLVWGTPVMIFVWIASVLIAAVPVWKAGVETPNEVKMETFSLQVGIVVSIAFALYRLNPWLS